MFEDAKATKLSEIPVVVKLQGDKILFGAILFIYPTLEGDSGRYVTAIKINESWSIFDDTKTQPYFVSQKKTFVVNALIYTEKEESAAHAAKHVLREPMRINASHETQTNTPTDHSQKSKKNGKENKTSAIPKPNHFNNGTGSSLSQSEREIVNKIVVLKNGGDGFGNTCGFDSVVQVIYAI